MKHRFLARVTHSSPGRLAMGHGHESGGSSERHEVKTHSDDDEEHNPSADSIHPSNRGGEHPVLFSADEIPMEW